MLDRQDFLHSSSKETQLLRVAFFFGEDCRSVVMTISDDVHDPELLTLTKGHQQKWIKKSCVSFEEECKSVVKVVLNN